MLREKDKKEMQDDARSVPRRDDFRKLRDAKQQYFTLAFMQKIIKNVKIKYPRHIIKADKNRL